MADKLEGDAAQGRDGALAALHEVAEDPDMIAGFDIATASFEDQDYEQLITLAWRFQFDEDRTKFKRELRALEEHVRNRILDRLELSG